MKICVAGAGFFGTMAAIRLAEAGHQVELWEARSDILQGASRNNHNRIHFGYHYLRSIETAAQCREGFHSFFETFGSAIVSEFPNYYCIAAAKSKTSPEQFEAFCETVRIPWRREYPHRDVLNRRLVAQCYRVPEPVFDYDEIKEIVKQMLEQSNLTARCNAPITNVKREENQFRVTVGGLCREYDAFVCATYCQTNRFNRLVGTPRRTYLYEDVVIPIFRYDALPFGVTIMDGEFCSVMPRGKRAGEFLLYHVKHSVRASLLGYECPTFDASPFDKRGIFAQSARYLPFLKGIQTIGQYQCVRVVRKNKCDTRRSTIYNDKPHYWSIVSGKVTTCVSVADALVCRIAGAACSAQARVHAPASSGALTCAYSLPPH